MSIFWNAVQIAIVISGSLLMFFIIAALYDIGRILRRWFR